MLSPVRNSLLCLLLSVALLLLASCITDHLANPAATQPATVIDPATTQVSFYLDKPPAAHIDSTDFDVLWNACESVARDYFYQLDRTDYRLGLITTQPMVSKNWFELWRKDAGTSAWVWRDSVQTVRRTLSFEVKRDDSGVYHAIPKVLVEQQTILEHRVSDVTQYRTVFSGTAHTPTLYTTDVTGPVPPKYWTPVARDTEMEKQVAAAVKLKMTPSMNSGQAR
jgi:hypothetical protein